jgi:hypothetical protein
MKRPEGQGMRCLRALHAMHLELRQIRLVHGEKLVGHPADLGQGEHGGGQRVVADGAVDRDGIAGQRAE